MADPAARTLKPLTTANLPAKKALGPKPALADRSNGVGNVRVWMPVSLERLCGIYMRSSRAFTDYLDGIYPRFSRNLFTLPAKFISISCLFQRIFSTEIWFYCSI